MPIVSRSASDTQNPGRYRSGRRSSTAGIASTICVCNQSHRGGSRRESSRKHVRSKNESRFVPPALPRCEASCTRGARRDTIVATPVRKASVSVLERIPMSSTPTVRLSIHAPPVRMVAAARASSHHRRSAALPPLTCKQTRLKMIVAGNDTRAVRLPSCATGSPVSDAVGTTATPIAPQAVVGWPNKLKTATRRASRRSSSSMGT